LPAGWRAAAVNPEDAFYLTHLGRLILLALRTSPPASRAATWQRLQAVLLRGGVGGPDG